MEHLLNHLLINPPELKFGVAIASKLLFQTSAFILHKLVLFTDENLSKTHLDNILPAHPEHNEAQLVIYRDPLASQKSGPEWCRLLTQLMGAVGVQHRQPHPPRCLQPLAVRPTPIHHSHPHPFLSRTTRLSSQQLIPAYAQP